MRAARARRLLRRAGFVLLLLACAALWRAAGQAAVVTQPAPSVGPTTAVEPAGPAGPS